MSAFSIQPIQPFKKRIEVPGDKSITHRALLFSGIATGTSRILHASDSADCRSTAACLRSLGVSVTKRKTSFIVQGKGPLLTEPENILDCGNSGSTMRIISGILAAQPFCAALTGDSSLRKRPMKRIVEPLRLMGASIFGREGGNYAPLFFSGPTRHPIEYRLPVASAQVKSSLLLAGLLTSGTTTIIEPMPSRDHTERMLAAMGAPIKKEKESIHIQGPHTLLSRDIDVPGDFSSAAPFIGLAAALPGASLTITRLGLNPTRTGLITVLKRMGASITTDSVIEKSGELIGDLTVKGTYLHGTEILPEEVPLLVDEIPLLAVIASIAKGRSIIRGAEELRFKESDRISAVAIALSAMGGAVEEEKDGLSLYGPVQLKGNIVHSQGDHRIAMALAIAGMLAKGTTFIENFECIKISFPEFANYTLQLREKDGSGPRMERVV
ncbi:MAG: 3-phosphoshikimate 1-carboxyvinyltransferase [Candidatus Ratteibacteria bacterium]|jgi:3-phosphoshikimate 1-carboxyvinyltransferase